MAFFDSFGQIFFFVLVVVVWMDSFRIYTADKTLNPDLGHACTTGHFRPAQFLERHPGGVLVLILCK